MYILTFHVTPASDNSCIKLHKGVKDMSRESMYVLISKMHSKLNQLIERSDYDLQDVRVQTYSRVLDRAIVRYSRIHGRR